MLSNILGKVTKPQHASVHNKVSRVKNLEGGISAPPAQIGLMASDNSVIHSAGNSMTFNSHLHRFNNFAAKTLLLFYL